MDAKTQLHALLREADAARILSISVQSLRRWRLQGEGPVFRKICGSVRYSADDLHAFIAAAARRSTSDSGEGAVGSTSVGAKAGAK